MQPQFLWWEKYRASDTQTRLVYGLSNGTKVEVIIEDPFLDPNMVTTLGNHLVAGYMVAISESRNHIHGAT